MILGEAATGKKVREWKQPGGVNGVAFVPDGRHLALANGNTTLCILRLAPPPPR